MYHSPRVVERQRRRHSGKRGPVTFAFIGLGSCAMLLNKAQGFKRNPLLAAPMTARELFLGAVFKQETLRRTTL